ncbi:MAG: DUF4348 domain-containing protein [Paludibacteraceae bacterium]|nr:DUF4348 domain-containing protein [Paludibacteraceae bacterium]
MSIRGSILLVFGLFTLENCWSEQFSRFFVDFFVDTKSQADKVTYPYFNGGDRTLVKSGWQTINLKNKNRIVIVCADSLEAVDKEDAVDVMVFYPSKSTGNKHSFSKQGKNWKLYNSRNFQTSELPDKDFMSFIERFSTDVDFQKKRAIFPLPEKTMETAENGTETQIGSKLHMPRTWAPVGFVGTTTQICSFVQTGEDANNRRIVIFENGIKSVSYNFISIRGNWFLIEIERYANKR